jgi:uncharacterized membrane protein YvbJ
MTLRCVACGHENQPGPSTCEKCGASLKGRGSIITTEGQTGTTSVRVVDFDIPIGQMMVLMIKWAIAAIPAAIIIGVVLALVMGFFAAIGAALP